jgi:predicted ATPase
MHIKLIRALKYKRFADLTVELDGRPRLVMLCGPNGSGKSSLFDALNLWHRLKSQQGISGDGSYHVKGSGNAAPEGGWDAPVNVEFHDDMDPQADPRKRIYMRSAYRNEPEFNLQELRRAGSIFDAPKPGRTIENDVKVNDNYQRMVSLTLGAVYQGEHDEESVRELRERSIGQLRDAVRRVYPELILVGPGDPLDGGTFYFEKGAEKGFEYKNLSGGEKAVFDLLLDAQVKAESYDDTVFCIDEPDAHTNPRVQGNVLEELLALVSERSQLWIATHSIGMMRRARDLQEADPAAVAFLDFQGLDFDEPQALRPVEVTRGFWARTLEVAMGDLANLVAPRRVVLCEGKPVQGNTARGEFDARCYREIFGDAMPDTDFISVGNEFEVQSDKLEVGRAIQTIVSGTNVVRVVDRDLKSDQEVADLKAAGVRVLGRRHLEAFLLDDEVLVALATKSGHPDKVDEVIAAKQTALDEIVADGKDPDDVKSAAGRTYLAIRKMLGLSGAGGTTEAFLADTLAPLIEPDMSVYQELKSDLFGTD